MSSSRLPEKAVKWRFCYLRYFLGCYGRHDIRHTPHTSSFQQIVNNEKIPLRVRTKPKRLLFALLGWLGLACF